MPITAFLGGKCLKNVLLGHPYNNVLNLQFTLNVKCKNNARNKQSISNMTCIIYHSLHVVIKMFVTNIFLCDLQKSNTRDVH